VYVVELRNEARVKAPAAERRNGPCVYVGETGLTPEERFTRHREGGRVASRIVRDHGVHLRPDLVDRGPFLTRANAAKAEKALGDKLRRRGFTVFGGTGKTFLRDAVADRL
jgi:hypothetical protein